MPLDQIASDVLLDILGYMPLRGIATILRVNKAWKHLVDANAAHVYRSAAVLHGFISKSDTLLNDAIAALDFDVPNGIDTWKEFCRLRWDIERNWGGLGRSRMRRLDFLGQNIFQAKQIGNLRIVSTLIPFGIAAYEADAAIWALPTDYLEERPLFAYDQGYLVFLRSKTVEVWYEASERPRTFDPSVEQKVAANSISEQYGSPTSGHFLPCFALPYPAELGLPQSIPNAIRLAHSTLVVVSPTQVHIWDLSTGKYLRALNTGSQLDHRRMRWGLKVDVSHDYILVFDDRQVRVFSRDDGRFVFHLSHLLEEYLPGRPEAFQMLPPREEGEDVNLERHDGDVLQKQKVFRKREDWTYPRGEFLQVGISPCGTILTTISTNNRVLLICDFDRVVAGRRRLTDVAVEIKLGAEYGDTLPDSPAVSRNRIALITSRGIVVIALNYAETNHRGSLSPSQIMASFMPLVRISKWSLMISGTKLFFGAHSSSTARTDVRLTRLHREKRPLNSRAPSKPVPAPARQDRLDILSEDDSDDSMPVLQSVSNSSDSEDSSEGEGDDDDEESWDESDTIASQSASSFKPNDEEEGALDHPYSQPSTHGEGVHSETVETPEIADEEGADTTENPELPVSTSEDEDSSEDEDGSLAQTTGPLPSTAALSNLLNQLHQLQLISNPNNHGQPPALPQPAPQVAVGLGPAAGPVNQEGPGHLGLYAFVVDMAPVFETKE